MTPTAGRFASAAGNGIRVGATATAGSARRSGSTAGAQRTRNAAIGSANPFNVNDPAGSNEWLLRLPTNDRTSPLTRIEPGSATASSRAASTTGVPWQSWPTYWTSPALSPMRSTSCSAGGAVELYRCRL